MKSQAEARFSVYLPSERFKYSNLGFALLGAVVSEISCITYEKYVKENILEPLKLDSIFPDYRDSVKNCLVNNGYGRDILGNDRDKLCNSPKLIW